jgi:hypothetical protein
MAKHIILQGEITMPAKKKVKPSKKISECGCKKELADKMAEAFLLGFEEAMIEIEKKADAFDAYMAKAADCFEKEYYKKPAKKAVKKVAKKKAIKKKK